MLLFSILHIQNNAYNFSINIVDKNVKKQGKNYNTYMLQVILNI